MYTLISSDSHVIEPADLWERHIESKYRSRAPRLVSEGEVDQWYVEGVPFGSIGTNQQAGLRFEAPEKLKTVGRMDSAPLGGIDPHEHVKDMDKDGVAGGVLFPSQGLHLYRTVPDSELLSAIFRAYNDWIAEFARPHPTRLKGLAMLNVDDPHDAVSELRRAHGLGLAGALIPMRTMTLRYDDPAYDPLWEAAQELGMPLNMHTGTHRWAPGRPFESPLQDVVEITTKEVEVRRALTAMVFGGVFERFPGVRVGALEFEIAWAPYFIERLDNTYKERAVGVKYARFKNGALPSDHFRQSVFISFQEDQLGIQLRDLIGVDNLVWGSDYPHAESTFPHSRRIVDETLRGLTDDEKQKIAGGNAARLYGFELQ
ncbi:MAG: amidohydrolase family protein [Burkholderiaceae bacterium]